MSVHGQAHWDRVTENGLMLAAVTRGADAKVVRWFGQLHDTFRDNEYGDPGHGPRAAAFIAELPEDALGLSDSQVETLVRACWIHNGADPVSDPTVGCCLDADRLDLGRVGITPDPDFFSTDAGFRLASMLAH